MNIKKIIQNFIRIVQKILITVFLIIIYIVGFGTTLIFVMIFKRRILIRKHSEKDTFWLKAKGCEFDIDSSMRQS